MAIVIVNIDDITFSINGINYIKNFVSVVNGDLVRIQNVYDGKLVLQQNSNYANYTVDGGSFGSAALLQAALVEVLFNRDLQGFESRISNLEQNQLTGVLYFSTKADMLAADATGQLNVAYKVISDTPTSNNGDYTSDGATYTQQTNAVNGIVIKGNVDAISGDTASKDNLNYTKATPSQNLFDKTTVTLGKYVRWNNGLLGTSANESASDYIPVKPSTQYTKENIDQLAFYDVSKVYISGESAVSTMVSPVGAAFVRISVLQTSLDTQQFVEGFVLPIYNTYETAVLISGEVAENDLRAVNGGNIYDYIKTENPFPSQIVTNEILVAPAGGQFTSLRAALLSITDASETNKYHITIKDALYQEIDIQGTNYTGTDLTVVVVEGESREGVTIQTNGLSTDLSPSDYSNPLYASIPINTIPVNFRHTFWLVKSVTFKNLTAIANDVKYVVHQDATGDYESLFENCHLIKDEPNDGSKGFVIGIGSRYKQFQRFRNCIIEARWYFNNGFSVAGIYWHNWNNQLGATGAEITDCHFVNCNEIEVADAGSDQNDIVTMSGCSTNSKLKGVAYTLLEGLYIPLPATPLDYPYNLVLNIDNSDVGNYVLDPNRANAADRALALNEYHLRVKNKSGVLIEKGYPVKINWLDNEVTNQVIEPATDNDFDFIMWTDVADGEIDYGIPKQKQATVIVFEGGYDRGDYLKIRNDGLFEITVLKADAVAVVLKDVSYGAGNTGELEAYLF